MVACKLAYRSNHHLGVSFQAWSAQALRESGEPHLVLPCDVRLALMHAGPSGELGALAANVRGLDMAGNLLPSWTEAACLGQPRPKPQACGIAK